MRPNHVLRWGLGLILFGGAIACIPEMASWSGDGNRLAFIRPADGKLYVWDHAKQEARLENSGAIAFCRFNPNTALDQILYGRDKRSLQPRSFIGRAAQTPPTHCTEVIKLVLSTGFEPTDMMPADNGGGRPYDFSPDGMKLYFINDNEQDKLTEVCELEVTGRVGESRIIHSCKAMISHIAVAPSGKRMILESSDSLEDNESPLALLDMEKGTTESLRLSRSGMTGMTR